jgi:hypothetical protein
VSREVTPLAQQRLPGLSRIIAVPGPEEEGEMALLGMLPVDMNLSGAGERLTDLVFAAMGRERALPVPGLARDEPRPLKTAA